MSGCVTNLIRYNFGMYSPPPPKLDPVYVLGFAFDDNKVLLIRKTKPKWQAGRLNGVGGKVEAFDKDYLAAMVREFHEETDILTTRDQWVEIGAHIRPSKYEGDDRAYKLVMFAINLTDHPEQIAQMHQTTEEEPVWFDYLENLGQLLVNQGVDGVGWYVAMAYQCDRPFYTTTIES